VSGRIAQTAAALRSGSTTSRELVEEALARADEQDAALGVFAARDPELALRAADHADAELAAGRDAGPLHGLPIGVKDLVATADLPTAAGSRVPVDDWHVPGGDAAVVGALRRGGAVVVGKTVTSELGMGYPLPGRGLPVPANPWDPTRWAGGSSSGSASGVATGMMLGAIGTDSGGSTRMPAAFCGVTGFKPTYGVLATDGCLPLAWSTDTVGLLAVGAEDCAQLMGVLTGDQAFMRDGSRPDRLRIGVDRLRRYAERVADPLLWQRFDDALAVLADAGATLVEVDLPLYDECVTASMVITLSEALTAHGDRLRDHWEELLPNTRQTIALATGFAAVDYVQAQRVRGAAQRRLAALHTEVDLVLTPMAAMTATAFDRLDDMLASGEFHAVNATYFNVVGTPALSLPMGPGADGLPLALQLTGPAGADRAVLATGACFQQRTSWHRQRPPTPARASGQPAHHPSHRVSSTRVQKEERCPTPS
jgi:aspartyl-tRNA(Asn)/glutamyl-tRNA(Gln) amidotransferase subunit A